MFESSFICTGFVMIAVIDAVVFNFLFLNPRALEPGIGRLSLAIDENPSATHLVFLMSKFYFSGLVIFLR